MNDRSQIYHQREGSVTPSRPTIALFSDELRLHIPAAFLRAAAAVAEAADVNFLYFSSEPVHSPFYFEIQANIFYEMISAANVDGILIASNLVGLYSSLAEISAFFQRYRPLPMVSMGLALDAVPSVVLDNFKGMYAVVTHLIEAHGYRRIAFLGGIEEHPEAQERYRAYTTALHDHGLALDPGLVVMGDFQPASGTRAVQMWLDERQYRPHHDIEAVVVANDYMAVGLLLELQTRGIKVPEEIAVSGFDDIAIGKSMTPPLTTVRQPFYEIGRQATELLLAQLAGKPVPELTRVPAKVVVRQSCGCAAPDTNKRVPSGHLPEKVVQTIREAPHQFFHQLNQAIYTTDSDMTIWDGALSLLRDEHAWIQPKAQQTSGDEPGVQIRAMLGETVFQSLQEKRNTQVLQRLGERIISTLIVSELMDALAEDLPRLGIRSGYVAFYEDPPPYQFPQPVPAWSRLILAYNDQGRIALPQEGQRFPTQDLMPQGFRSSEHARRMVVEALYFQREQIGFALFEVGAQEETMYGALRRYLSSSLQGALLVQRVRERSAEIARQKYILDTFMANVPDSIYFKDRESRITHVNRAHAASFGLRDPSEEIGKTDFDFFPEEQARPKYEQEQAIIRTGQPLLALEEPDAQGRWSLTTKMPLRDEHGTIIGTFGISRDITELKLAQKALEKAYGEISTLNTQLEEENVRMSAELNISRQIQQMILPPAEELRQIQGLDIVGYMQPAEEVGGDYYDVLLEHGVIHIGIGDVTGHGLESGILMLMTQTAIRTLIEHGETDPAAFLSTLNRVILKNAQRMQTDKNLTFALIKYEQGEVKIIGQHEEVLVVRKEGQVERVETMKLGFQIGMVAEIAQWVNEATVTLRPGDGVVLYTDGITEAENTARQFYGLERLCQVISEHWDQPAEAIKQAVIDDVTQFIGKHTVYDDITLVVLKQK